MLEKFFDGFEIRSEFNKEFISIFDGWLGAENLHRLDEVNDLERERFNALLRALNDKYRLYKVDLNSKRCEMIKNIDSVISSHEQNQDKQSIEFTRIIIPEIQTALTEEWDYTWILWHKNYDTVEALSPLILQANLFHWRDS